MPKKLDQMEVFLSAPSSMDAQRRVITNTVASLPNAALESFGIRFKIINWQSSLLPGIGSDPQHVISSQTDDYDIYIGLLGTHFGTPTPRAGSGTEDEFDQAYRRYIRAPNSVRVLFYFKTSVENIRSIDVDQLEKVRSFQEKLKKSGVFYHEFSTDDALASMISDHLLQLIQKQWDGQHWKVLSSADNGVRAAPLGTTEMLIEADQEEEECEPGILDLVVDGLEAQERLLKVMSAIGSHHDALTASVTEPATIISESDHTPAQLKWAVDEAANGLKQYARNMTGEFPAFKGLTDQVILVMSKMVDLIVQEGSNQKDGLAQFPDAIDSLLGGMRGVRLSIDSLQTTVLAIVGLTGKFKQARKLAAEVMAEYAAYITVTIKVLEDQRLNIVKLLA